jgi:hypothetical protein
VAENLSGFCNAAVWDGFERAFESVFVNSVVQYMTADQLESKL